MHTHIHTHARARVRSPMFAPAFADSEAHFYVKFMVNRFTHMTHSFLCYQRIHAKMAVFRPFLCLKIARLARVYLLVASTRQLSIRLGVPHSGGTLFNFSQIVSRKAIFREDRLGVCRHFFPFFFLVVSRFMHV